MKQIETKYDYVAFGICDTFEIDLNNLSNLVTEKIKVLKLLYATEYRTGELSRVIYSNRRTVDKTDESDKDNEDVYKEIDEFGSYVMFKVIDDDENEDNNNGDVLLAKVYKLFKIFKGIEPYIVKELESIEFYELDNGERLIYVGVSC